MELDIEDFGVLQEYLRSNGHIDAGSTVTFQKLLGGVSNRTVRALLPNGRAWIFKQALSKLRVKVDWFCDPERIRVEAAALQFFNRLAPPGTTPPFIFEDIENHLVVMEAIPEGHQNWKSILLRGEVRQEHFEQFGVLLGTIHRRSSDIAVEVSQVFADTTYFETLRLEPYYIYTAEQTPAAASFLQRLAQETLLEKFSLVHGDFSPKNTLIYQDSLIIIDYEVAHFGDPAFDVGFALTHFLSKAHHLPSERGRLGDAALLFWHTYRKEVSPLAWADTLERRVVSHTLGCLLARVAGKSQLEYLASVEVLRQRDVVLSLIANPPQRVPDLVDDFIRKININAEN